MDNITLKGFRCFREEQTARLAPLTLLVGENSTGKTSFMAMIRALWDTAYRLQIPDFKEAPYDLGSFDEVAYHRDRREGPKNSFEAGFDFMPTGEEAKTCKGAYRFEATFERVGTTPVPARRRLERGKYWVEERLLENRNWQVRVGTSKGVWQYQELSSHKSPPLDLRTLMIRPLYYSLIDEGSLKSIFSALENSPPITKKELNTLRQFVFESEIGFPFYEESQRPFASAPVRSKPSRTYDPARPAPDPEGAYVPMYLASVYFHDRSTWEDLKHRLEDFGRISGLFDEISVKTLGRRDAEPFQVQVRKFGGKLKGLHRNLIDVGYGVSQALPMITELLRREAPSMFLLQQPEVHLHPSAQAALGSFFCEIASTERRLIVETHSDHILDRVRMDVRDGRTRLRPEDVSILFFEAQRIRRRYPCA